MAAANEELQGGRTRLVDFATFLEHGSGKQIEDARIQRELQKKAASPASSRGKDGNSWQKRKAMGQESSRGTKDSMTRSRAQKP